MVQPVRRPKRRRRRHLRAWHLALALAVLVVAAGAAALWLSRGDAPEVASAPTADVSDGQSEDGGTEGSSTSTTAATTTTTVRDPVLGNGTPVTLAFAGDTNFEGVIADRLAADPASVFGPIVPVLAGADLTVVNMETAIGHGGTAAPKEFTFQAPPEAL
jgi:poly-gamma-glutamate synthesis protein (capsule biosynthesis protein)